MIPYIIVFVVVYVIGLIIDYLNKRNKETKITMVLFIVVLTIISAFAGLRCENVGTDVLVYPKPIYESLKNHSFWIVYKSSNVEIGFMMLAYMIRIINGSFSTFLFLIQFVTCGMYLLFVYKNREELNVSSMILSYCMIIFGFSLNLMRQFISVSIIIFGYNYVKKRNFKKYIITVLIATLFHQTALIASIIYFIYGLKNTKKGFFIKWILCGGIIIACLSLTPLMSLLIDIGMLPNKYTSYLTRFYQSSIDIQIIALYLKIMLMFISYYILNLLSKYEKENSNCMKVLLILDLIFFLVGSKISYGERIAHYFSFLVYTYIFGRYQKITNNFYFRIFNILIMITYFIIIFVILDNSQIIPYTSSFLNIY